MQSRLRVGDTLLTAEGWLGFKGKEIDTLSVAVKVPHLYLKDLGLQAEQAGTTAYKPVERIDEVEPGNRLANSRK